MQINKEPGGIHSIQSYSDTEIKINGVIYTTNLIICRDEIILDWSIGQLSALDDDFLTPILNTQPEVIIIGHNQTGAQPPIKVLQHLSQKRIGLECMSIGAACRTFNVLLSEDRKVTLGIIL